MDDNRSENKISLDMLVETYIVEKYAKHFNDINKDNETSSRENTVLPEEQNLIFQAAKTTIRENIVQEIRKELTQEEYKAIKIKAKRKYQENRAKERIKWSVITLVEGIILAIFVGLLVNQITNALSIFEEYTMRMITIFATVIIVLFGIAVAGIIFLLFMDLFGENKEKEE